MQKKHGVTLITLGIAVVILAVLTTITIINIDNIIPSARKSKIGEEFMLIESKIKEYYLLYGKYPVLENITYTKSEIEELNTNGKAEMLGIEIAQNGDDNAIFFLVDLEALRLNTLLFGNRATRDDIYIASNLTGMLYYPKGIEVEDKTIFSTGAFKENTHIY